MVQILGFVSDTWNAISFSIINGVFGIVAKIYDILLQIAYQTYDIDGKYFEQFATLVYVLAGVFMLFRVTISLLQMLVNPDQINDKKVGAGKVVTRVITSIVLLMLFVPNGLLFGQSGLFARVEKAVLAKDGIVTQFMNLTQATSKKENNVNNDKPKDNFLVDNVYAEEKLTCFYISTGNHKRDAWSGGPTKRFELTLNNVYKIEFYSGKSGDRKIEGTSYTYSVKDNQRIAGKDEYGKYHSLERPIAAGSAFKNSFPKECPRYLTNGDKEKTHEAKKKSNDYPGLDSCMPKVATNQKVDCKDANGLVWVGNSFNEMDTLVKKLQTKTTGDTYSVTTNHPYLKKYTKEDAITKPMNKEYLNNLAYRDQSIAFAQNAASSLQECVNDEKEACEEAQSEMFKTVDGNNKIKDLMDDDALDVSFIFSILAGAGFIVYLMYLCIEVILRKLKLFFLQMISPLPIICYINPNDKIFNQWIKMYLSTYVDLFIKLISISIAINLLDTVILEFNNQSNLLIKFFYIVAVLVFAKVVPTMISKIFGLDSMGGSFKDIMGMGKAALGFGAGAAVGAVTGAMTGKGLGRLSGFAKGAMLGAGAGSKGKVLGGSNAIAAKNARINDAKANGLGFWQRTAAGMAGTLGYNPKTSMDNKIKDRVDAMKMLDEHRKQKDNIEDMAEKSAFLSDLKTQMANGQLGKGEYKKIKKAFIMHIDEQSKMKPVDRTDFSIEGIKDSNGKSLNLTYKNGQTITGSWKYDDSDADKVTHAIDIAKSAYDSNHALQDEITKSNGGIPIAINSYADYLNTEGIATKSRNAKDKEITTVQSSDQYHRAQAFEDYSKSSK